MDNIIYLNGKFTHKDNAYVSVLDRAYLFGDAIYEVVPIYAGVPFLATEHFHRLSQSLKKAGIQNPFTLQSWLKLITDLYLNNTNSIDNKSTKHGGSENKKFYLQISRGVQAQRIHKPGSIQPSCLAFCQTIPPLTQTLPPQDAIIIEDQRWSNCDIKTTSLLASSMALFAAEQAKVNDVIFSRNGIITESSSSNVFIVKDNCILTHPADNHVLHGVTRALVIKLAKANGIQVKEQKFTETQLLTADEVWLTGSLKCIVPLVAINRQKIGNGEVGPLLQKMLKCYLDYVADYVHKHSFSLIT